MPFLRTNVPKRFWTFRDCRDTTVMGYTYEELSLDIAALTSDINTKYMWMANDQNMHRRPPRRELTGFPVDFGKNRSLAPCLPKTVFVDRGDMFPQQYIREAPVEPDVDQIRPIREWQIFVRAET